MAATSITVPPPPPHPNNSELLITKEKFNGSHSCSNSSNCIWHLQQYPPEPVVEKASDTSTRWLEFIIFRSTFKCSFMLGSRVTVCTTAGNYHISIQAPALGYRNTSPRKCLAKKLHRYTVKVKIERWGNDDEVRCWVSYNNCSLHFFPLVMCSIVIMLASCHMDYYSSFLLLLEFRSASHSLSTHRVTVFALWAGT